MNSVLTNVLIADGTPAGTEPVDVVITGDTVAAIQPAGSRHSGDRVVADGGVVSPGLVDGHVHFPKDNPQVNAIIAMHYVANGVTSVLCMDGSPEVLRLRAEIDGGLTLGPRVWTTGPVQNDPDLTYRDGRAALEAQLALGYDAVKVYNELSRPGFDGLLAGARAGRLPVVGHVVRSVGMPATIESGQMHIAHLEEILYTHLGISMDLLLQGKPLTIDEEAVTALAAELIRGTRTVGTTIEALASASGQVRDAAQWCERPDIRQLPERLQEQWRPPVNRYENGYPDERHPVAFERLVDLVSQVARVLDRAGVRLVAGSDALICGVPPGTSMRREIGHLVRAGLSAGHAMRAAISPPLTTAEHAVPRIEAGTPADLILLPGDPFVSAAHLDSIRGVVVRGSYSEAGEINRMIRQATARLDAEPAQIAD